MAKLRGHELNKVGLTLCDIKKTFRSAGWINAD